MGQILKPSGSAPPAESAERMSALHATAAVQALCAAQPQNRKACRMHGTLQELVRQLNMQKDPTIQLVTVAALMEICSEEKENMDLCRQTIHKASLCNMLKCHPSQSHDYQKILNLVLLLWPDYTIETDSSLSEWR